MRVRIGKLTEDLEEKTQANSELNAKLSQAETRILVLSQQLEEVKSSQIQNELREMMIENQNRRLDHAAKTTVKAQMLEQTERDFRWEERMNQLEVLLAKRTRALQLSKSRLFTTTIRLIGAMSELERLRGIKFRAVR